MRGKKLQTVRNDILNANNSWYNLVQSMAAGKDLIRQRQF